MSSKRAKKAIVSPPKTLSPPKSDKPLAAQFKLTFNPFAKEGANPQYIRAYESARLFMSHQDRPMTPQQRSILASYIAQCDDVMLKASQHNTFDPREAAALIEPTRVQVSARPVTAQKPKDSSADRAIAAHSGKITVFSTKGLDLSGVSAALGMPADVYSAPADVPSAPIERKVLDAPAAERILHHNEVVRIARAQGADDMRRLYRATSTSIVWC